MASGFKNLPKEAKCEIILDYVKKIYAEESRLVSKREIRRVFHVGLYNYFESVFALYQRAGITTPLYLYPKKLARKKIIEFVQERSRRELYPMQKEIEKEWNLQLRTYFKSLEGLYRQAGIDFNLYKRRRYYIEAGFNSPQENRTNEKNILNFIKENVEKGFYPSVPVIQRMLKLSFYTYFPSIFAAYKKAGVPYKRPCPIILGREKELVLTRILIELFKRKNYIIKRVSIFDKKRPNKGADMHLLNPNGEDILVEVKAYRKNAFVTNREVSQLQKYLLRRGIKQGLFITTSKKISKLSLSFPSIEFICGNKLISLLEEYDLAHFFSDIEWVMTERVNDFERIKAKKKKRDLMISYVLENKDITSLKQLERIFNISKRTYFGKISSKEGVKKIRKGMLNTDSALVCRDRSLLHQYNRLALDLVL